MTERVEPQSGKRTNIHSSLVPSRADPANAPAGIVHRVRALPLWQPLRGPVFRRLWAGEAASLLADQTFFVVLTFLVLQGAGPGAQLGSVLAVAAIPGAVLLPVGGWLSDRFPPAAIMTVTSTGRALLMGTLAGLVLLGGLLSALDAFYYPASMSIVPSIVADDQLEPANALVQGAEQVSGMIGPVLAAGLAATVGLGAAFGATALSFALAAAAFAAVAVGTRGARAKPKTEDGGITAILAGARYAWGDPVIRTLLLLIAALNTAAAGPIVVGSAVLATERLGGPGALGFVYAGFGAGSLLGVIAAGSLARRQRRGRMLLIVTAGFALGLMAFGLTPTLPVAAVIAAVMGALGGYLGVVLIAWLQERTAPEVLGRVMSLVVFAAVALDPVSYALSGLLVGGGVERLFLGAGAVMLVTATIAATSRSVREFQ